MRTRVKHGARCGHTVLGVGWVWGAPHLPVTEEVGKRVGFWRQTDLGLTPGPAASSLFDLGKVLSPLGRGRGQCSLLYLSFPLRQFIFL